MKKGLKITVVLRDNKGNPYPVKIYEGKEVIIEIYRDNMVMTRPKQFDTNKMDKGKQYFHNGGMQFTATKEFVEKFNTFTDVYEAEQFCHDVYMQRVHATEKIGSLEDLLGIEPGVTLTADEFIILAKGGKH